jgi:sialate O-acetylesterase
MKRENLSQLLRRSGSVLVAIGLILSCGASGPPAKNISLPSIFSENMVLQQGIPVPVWGQADSGGVVTVEIAGQRKSAVARAENKWQVRFNALKAGGPYEMKIFGADTTVIENILVGEVWLCSGQSNMEWQVRNSNDAQQELNAANWPEIRMFTVEHRVAQTPQTDCAGDWKICTPENAGDFSAVGYFFGRELHQQLSVPVGLIHTSWGGTPAEAWTRYETLLADSMLLPIITRHEDDLKNYPQRFAEYEAALKKIEASGARLPVHQTDAGNQGLAAGWAKPDFNVAAWDSIPVPGFWENRADLQIDGAVWFRKTVQIPETWQGKDLQLALGAIDDFDETWFNGVKVGQTGEDTPQFWIFPRKYRIPGEIVQPGPAVIAVRIFDHFGQGGFAGPGTAMKLAREMESGEELIALPGLWKFKTETALDPASISGPGGTGLPDEPRGPNHPHSPAGLYHAMLFPLAPYALKGAIWYQGETNAGRAFQYRTLLPAMIQSWRTLWDQGDFPFGIVQLANFMNLSEEPQASAWAELREAQALTAFHDPNNGLAVTIDIGAADDIHPRNKQDVGKRLARWALAQSYDEKIEYSGPVYQSMQVLDGKIALTFSHTADSLMPPDGSELKGFAIAGADYHFVWANAKIEKNRVIVWSDKIASPVAVRYAWADNPVCNLYNSAGLPAVPFRTDQQPESTFLNR